MANVNRMRPVTMRKAPSQSISTLTGEFFLSWMSEGIVRYAVIAVAAVRTVPIQKYQPQVVYSAVTPAKKIPMIIITSALRF